MVFEVSCTTMIFATLRTSDDAPMLLSRVAAFPGG